MVFTGLRVGQGLLIIKLTVSGPITNGRMAECPKLPRLSSLEYLFVPVDPVEWFDHIHRIVWLNNMWINSTYNWFDCPSRAMFRDPFGHAPSCAAHTQFRKPNETSVHWRNLLRLAPYSLIASIRLVWIWSELGLLGIGIINCTWQATVYTISFIFFNDRLIYLNFLWTPVLSPMFIVF